jgi:N-methylhydantoinase B/oxoprolinase/acetone carboxylase alpha subunit
LDRQDYFPFGLADGKEGTASITLFNPGTLNERLLPGKTTREIRSGDVIRHLAAGGGYGPAGSRDVDRINADLRNKKFSAEFAGHIIGRIS